MYLTYDQRALDIQYSPSSRVADINVFLREYAERSAQARDRLDVLSGVRCGPRPEQLLDYFPAARPGGPLLVFIHGGYWQELSRLESSFMALDLVPRGISVAALGYGLAPTYGLPEIVDMVAEGVRWICRNACQLPASPRSVYLSGCSAGAHLAVMALLDTSGGQRDGDRPDRAVAGAILLSGVYDLEPVRRTYVNRALGLDPGTARDYSPMRRLPAVLPPLVVARGENETDEFGRQQAEFVEAVRACGSRVVDLVVPSRNHFDLAFDLGVPGTMLGDSLTELIGLDE
ncbi:alpha/beta hydrolase [Micromonospora andamanensis]|uniref:Esterase n=1 Tax=Micromonospora andamanensis TaxID=1287068 RepID=A0ABQ4HW14_9ACTN|nr:alpha/beta hydrolase [Micromonospora andamanensis]GIJ09819.1 esterase [Micromonospora andamanensis]